MKKRLPKIACLLIFLVSIFANGQTYEFKDDKGDVYTVDKKEKVVIQSWKKGTETVKNQQIKLVLSSKNKKYQQEIIGDSGKRYLLKIDHRPYFNLEFEHWEIKMFEVLTNKRKPKLSENLLSTEQYGSFTQDAFIGVLYPEEEPLVFSAKNEVLWGEGQGFYYFKTIRKINFESFCIVIKVGDYKFNKKNKTKLDLFEIFIDFTSPCSEQ